MINVSIVDDDAMVAELNRLYVARVPGFRCSGSASTLSQAQEMINDPQQEIDLVLLDVHAAGQRARSPADHPRVGARHRRYHDYLGGEMPPRYRPRCITGWSIT